jgi:hypothetical protein
MRRSAAVRLTLLPMLASAVASADDGGIADAGPADARPTSDIVDPWDPWRDIELRPPGMTPSTDELDCDDDPNWQLRSNCDEDVMLVDGDERVVIRGGFGGYYRLGGGT